MSKMHYVVMLSRWQEATVNKKYEVKIGEAQQYASECKRLQSELEVKHQEFIKSEEEARLVRIENKQLRKKMDGLVGSTISKGQEREISRKIAVLMTERTDLEDKYYKVRNDAIGHMDMFERERMRAEIAVDQLYKFKNFGDDEIADDNLKLSDEMLNHKLDAQRQRRRKDEAEEQVNYLSRLLDNKTKEVTFMEEKLAKLEKDYTKKEQQWRA